MQHVLLKKNQDLPIGYIAVALKGLLKRIFSRKIGLGRQLEEEVLGPFHTGK